MPASASNGGSVGAGAGSRTRPAFVGNSTKNDAPRPWGDSTRMRPPCSCTMAYATVRPSPVPCADFLRREERIENLRLHVFRHAWAVVVNLEDDRALVALVPRAHDEGAAAVRREHGLFGVDHEVQQHLLHLVWVREHLRQPRSERVDHGDVGHALLVGAEGQRIAQDVIQVHHRARALALAREGEQVAHNPRCALRLREDRLDPAPRGGVHLARRQALGPREDRRERIVQLVRHTGDRLAECGQLLRLQQLGVEIARLVVELLALAHISQQCLDCATGRSRSAPLGPSAPPRPGCRRRAGGAAGDRRPTPRLPAGRGMRRALADRGTGTGSKGRTSASGTSAACPNINLRWGLAASVDVWSLPTVPMYTPSCTASNSRANASARASGSAVGSEVGRLCAATGTRLYAPRGPVRSAASASHRLGPKKNRSTTTIARMPPAVTTRRGMSLSMRFRS